MQTLSYCLIFTALVMLATSMIENNTLQAANDAALAVNQAVITEIYSEG